MVGLKTKWVQDLDEGSKHAMSIKGKEFPSRPPVRLSRESQLSRRMAIVSFKSRVESWWCC